MMSAGSSKLHMTESFPQPVAAALSPRRFRSLRTILALMLREMATTYGKSPGGYIWAVLEPVGAIAILSVVFSFVFRSPALGNNFPQFYATAFLPFMMYATLTQKIGQSIQFSRPLLAYPAVTYIDAIMARFLLNLLTQVMVFYIVMTGIDIIYDTSAILNIPAILLSLAMAAALGLGIGTLNCFLMGMFPVWSVVWNILNRPMFIISGVFFVYESIPAELQDYLWFNPLIHVTGEMRKGFYATYDAAYVSPLYVLGVSLVTFVLGLVFLVRYHRDILNER